MPRKPAIQNAFQMIDAVAEPKILDKSKKTIAQAANIINETFVWERTKEGYKYWRDVCLGLKRLAKAADMLLVNPAADVAKVRIYVKDEELQKPEVKRAKKTNKR